MSKKKEIKSAWYDGVTPLADLAPNQQLAHQIVTERNDLTPSVMRIMTAELSDDQQREALGLFRASLEAAGDPNRNPSVAIANAEAGHQA